MRHKHSPATIPLSTFHIFLGNQLIQQLLNSRHTDTRFIFHVCKRQRGLSSHSVQNFCIIGCSECNPLSIIPPHILIPLAHEQHIIIHFRSHQVIEIFQKRTDILNPCMGSITGDRTYFEIRLMQSFQIFTFSAAPDYNHRIIMTSQNVVHHQPGNATVTVLERVNADITVVKQCGQLYWR